jgi:hypothetical protein
MGADDSRSRGQRIPADWKRTHGLYSHYKWTVDQLRTEINAGRLSPLDPGLDSAAPPSTVFCEICYRYYMSVNETSCCQRHICSECIAATWNPPPAPVACPFCRQAGISWVPNSVRGGANEDSAEYQQYLDKLLKGEADTAEDDGPQLPPEQNAEAREIARNFNVNVRTLRELFAAGLSRDEIIAQLGDRT